MKRILLAVLMLSFLFSCSGSKKTVTELEAGDESKSSLLKWRAVHLLNYTSDNALKNLERNIPKLAEMGINKIILEVDYHFQFKSHPELRQTDTTITEAGAKSLTQVCQANGIEVIPQFQCLGHQSWAEETYKLLEVYPEFDLTPGAFPNNEGLYCREWDVKNPKVYEIVFKLMDEIITAFDAKAMHVGMDEVFLLGSDESPSTKGEDPAELFANAVNEIYDFLVMDKGVEMLMWGDRLIDAEQINYGEWESSMNGTASAIDMIPKDIIICDWHYESLDTYNNLVQDGYASIPMFIDKGFRVIPTSWRIVENMKSLMKYSLKQNNPRMLGHLFTLWSNAKGDELISYPPMVEGLHFGKPYFQ